jgi:hypothetical protein
MEAGLEVAQAGQGEMEVGLAAATAQAGEVEGEMVEAGEGEAAQAVEMEVRVGEEVTVAALVKKCIMQESS